MCYTKLRLFSDVMYHFHPNRLPHLFAMHSNCHSDSLSSTMPISVCQSIHTVAYVVVAVDAVAVVVVATAAVVSAADAAVALFPDMLSILRPLSKHSNIQLGKQKKNNKLAYFRYEAKPNI